MLLEKIKSAYPTLVLITLLTAFSLVTTHLIVTQSYLIGPIVILGLMCLLALGWMMRDYKMGIYFIFVLSVFMSFVNRMLGASIQFGIATDILSALTFFFMFFTN